MSESKKNLNLTRRKFMAVSSAAIAAPFVMKMTGTVPHVEAVEKEVDKKYAGMKSIVLYYSMTGNTKKIAQALQKGIIQRTGQCDLVRLKDSKLDKLKLENYNLIGIGSPVLLGGITPQYTDYVNKRLPLNVKGKHAFFYATHGILPGRVIIEGVKPLQEQGLTVIGWKDWYCGLYVPIPGHAVPWLSDGHPDAIDLAEAEAFGTAMAEHSRKISEGRTSIIPTLPSPEAIDAFYVGLGTGDQTERPSNGASMPQMPQSKITRRINAEKCIGCGLCAKACYFEVIDASAKPAVIKRPEDCVNCGFCSGVCPTGAVEGRDPIGGMGFENMTTMSHDEWLRATDLAEATGHFRRLVREEDLVWGIPWEKVKGSPPRIKEIF